MTRILAARTVLVALACAFAAVGGAFSSRDCWGGFSIGLSRELWDAPCASDPYGRARLWTKLHTADIRDAAKRFDVDPRAIAGIIEAEALLNIHLIGVFTRSSGPGKVHYKSQYFGEGNPVSKQVETKGLVPPRTMAARTAILGGASGASTYIAAILSVFRKQALAAGYDLRCNPGLLATLYSAYTFDASEEFFLRHHAPSIMRVNEVGDWVDHHLPDIDNDVGGCQSLNSYRPSDPGRALSRPGPSRQGDRGKR